MLGYDPCYHMNIISENKHEDLWLPVFEGKKMNWNRIFNKFKASLDVPINMYWEEILKEYPNSKVILTVRSPESWLKSMNETIIYKNFHTPLGVKFMNWINPSLGYHHYFIKKMFYKIIDENITDETLLKAFKEHNKSVIEKCPKDKLLVFEAAQEWEPLCKFLEKEIPNKPYPRVWDKEAFNNELTRRINRIGYLLIFATIGIISVGGYYIKKNLFNKFNFSFR